MKNRFIKKNLKMVVFLSVAAVASLALVVVAVIYGIELISVTSEIKENSESINRIRSERRECSTGQENIDLIKVDVATYKMATDVLYSFHGKPLNKAVEFFVNALDAPLAAQLSDEEVERYGEPLPENVDPAGVTKAARKIRRLTLAEFKELFDSRLQAYNYDEEKRVNYNFAIQEFIYSFKQIFPEKSWEGAVNAFAVEAQKHILEKIDVDVNAVPLLFYALGYRRVVENKEAGFNMLVNFRSVIENGIENYVGHDQMFPAALKNALDTFAGELMPPVKEYLTADEIKRYSNEKGELRKLTAAEFCQFVAGRVAAKKQDNWKLAQLVTFVNEIQRIFPQWSGAMSKFKTAIRKAEHYFEAINDDEQVRMLFLYAVCRSYGSVKDGAMKSFLYEVENNLRSKKLVWEANAQNLLVSWNDQNQRFPDSLLQRNIILFHWEQLAFMVNLIKASRISNFSNIALAMESGDGAMSMDASYAAAGMGPDVTTSIRDLGNGFEAARYAIEVVGSMESIRDLTKRFDNAFVNNKRCYLVKSVSLYAVRDEIQELRSFNKDDKQQQDNNNAEPAPEGGRRSWLRGNRNNQPVAPQSEQTGNQQKPQADMMLDYGAVRLGATEVRAVIVLDYVFLKRDEK